MVFGSDQPCPSINLATKTTERVGPVDPRQTFVSRAISKNEETSLGIFGFHLLTALCNDHLDATDICAPLQKNILDRTRADDPFCINDGTPCAGCELSGLDAGKVRLSFGGHADPIDCR